MVDIAIESMRDGDEGARHRLGRQAFGGTTTFDPSAPTFPPDRMVAAYQGDELVGAVAAHAFHQHWGSAAISCGGVAGVLVAPEARGLGVARSMLAESFERMMSRGEVLSALFPTTATLYRSMGYEFAGWWRRSKVDGSQLPLRAADDCEWRRVEFDDPVLAEITQAMAPDHDGWLRHSPLWWEWRAHGARTDHGTNRDAYVGRRGGADVAAVIFHQTPSERGLYGLTTDLLVGVDGDGVASALGLLARHGTTAPEIATTLPPHVLGLHVPHVQLLETVDQWAWMIRLVDVAECMRRRGYPHAVSGSVALAVHDDVLPHNEGRAVFTLNDGIPSWEPGGAGTVDAGVADLAALFGGADPRLLASTGRLPGAQPSDVAFLRAAFSATPSAVDFF